MALSSSERSRRYAAAHPERRADQFRRYREANRERILVKRRAFYKANAERLRAEALERSRANPEAHRERSRLYALRNPDYGRNYKVVHAAEEAERGARWKRDHPENVREMTARRRARMTGAFLVTNRDWRRLVARYRNCCAYCGQRTASLQKEHVIPIHRGGRHSIGNLVPACGPCNYRKHTALPIEFRTSSRWTGFKEQAA